MPHNKTMNWLVIAGIALGVIYAFVVILKSSSWDTVEGLVIESDFETISHTVSSEPKFGEKRFEYKLNIQYEYRVAGFSYIGDKIVARLPNSVSELRTAEELVEKYPVAAAVEVFYNPKNPEDSCLETLKGLATWRIVMFVVLILGLLAAVLAGFYFVNKLIKF